MVESSLVTAPTVLPLGICQAQRQTFSHKRLSSRLLCLSPQPRNLVLSLAAVEIKPTPQNCCYKKDKYIPAKIVFCPCVPRKAQKQTHIYPRIACILISINTYIHIHIHIYICICIYIYIHTCTGLFLLMH